MTDVRNGCGKSNSCQKVMTDEKFILLEISSTQNLFLIQELGILYYKYKAVRLI